MEKTREQDAEEVVEFVCRHKVILSTVHGSLIQLKGAETRPDEVYQTSEDDWTFLPHRIEICQLLSERNIPFGICSNEGGVAYGNLSGPKMVRELWKIGNRLHAMSIQYCMNHPNGSDVRYKYETSRRFPKQEMLRDALLESAARLDVDAFYSTEALLLYHLKEERLAAKEYGMHTLDASRFFSEEVYNALEKVAVRE